MLFASRGTGGGDVAVPEEGPPGGMNGWGEGGRRGAKGGRSKAPKNDPFRFEGDGLSFRAKLIGTETVDSARGDRMCQEAMQRLKSAVKLSGEHKQRVLLGVSLQGIKVRDEKTGDLVFHHPVHKISFISQDTGDARAFGYVCGSPQGGHRFVAIKTEKGASQLVIALRDLFQVVLEMKQHEMLRAKENHEKHKADQDTAEESCAGQANGADFSRRGEVQEVLHEEAPAGREASPAVVDDLLDLQFELDSLQQGIEQMETSIAVAAGTTADPFDTSFVANPGSRPSRPFFSQPVTPASPLPPLLPPPLPARVPPTFLPFSTPTTPSAPGGGPFSPAFAAFRSGGSRDPFRARPPQTLPLRADNPFATVSLPATPAAPTEAVPPALPPKKPPVADLFAELDPLAKDRPYRDRAEFFRELKKPAKKVLRDLREEDAPGPAFGSISRVN